MMKRSSLSFCFLSLIFTLSFTNQSCAQTYERVKDADVHEAFVTRVTGNILIDAHPQHPPAPIRERIPRQTDEAAVWLGGYWAWSDSKQDYIWTSGVWRRPPPGHQWIDGLWKEYDDGWAWIPGFWSDKDPNKLSYIDLAPPAAIEENVPSSPQDDYFWNPGFWWYNPNTDDYKWVDGQWEALDPNWVLIPAHYTWRPEGYVFIDAYWDWPIDSLGEAYETVYIPPAQRDTIIYEPANVVEITYIIDHYFYSYPDYSSFYYHHYHYNPHYWENYCCAPQWWRWNSWWGLSWSNQWGLWWWYSNPGYPAPIWITSNISAILPPPRAALYNRMERVRPPKFITPRGVVSPNAILKETQRISGNRRPVLPPGRRERDKIWEGVTPKGNRDIRPKGRPRPFDPNIRRPGPRVPNIDREAGQRVPRAPEGRRPRMPKRPDRASIPRPDKRPDYRVPKPDVKQPPSRRPDSDRFPEGRTPRPRPDFDRPDFGRPPGRRPSAPRPDINRDNFRRPQDRRIKPEIRQPDKPKISYPPGFKDAPSKEIQRQPQRIKQSGNQPSEIRREVRKKIDIKQERRQQRLKNQRNDENDD